MIKDYRELRVYKNAFEMAADVYEVSKSFPSEERYVLTDQIRRSSRSVCANIAESWRRRRSARHFVAKLSDADAEAAETAVWLDFALRFGFLDQGQYTRLSDACDHVSRQLALLIQAPEPWLQKTRG